MSQRGVMEMLGHTSDRMVVRYQHVVEQKVDDAKRLDDYWRRSG